MDLTSLNPPQREAVEFGDGPLVVFAGAGSGKTRVITYRVAHLVTHRGVAPWRILAVTFTNKAAQEMRERLLHLLGEQAREVWVGTFHATCAKLLRLHAAELGIRSDFTIYDDQDSQALLKRVLRDLDLDDKRFDAKSVGNKIERAKQELIRPGAYPCGDEADLTIARIYADYESRLRAANAFDFGDLISVTAHALHENVNFRAALQRRFEHVLVDEFQDTNRAQFRWIQGVVGSRNNICVVGDDDQSIYRWRGADRRNILDFRAAFENCTTIKLEQNYRSTQRILRAANSVIERNTDREPKRLWTENEEGDPLVVVKVADERAEARLVLRGIEELLGIGYDLRDIVVFYRIHAQSRVIEEALRASNLPYRIIGGVRFYDRAEVKDVLAYLRVLHNPSDDVSLLRIINVPARGIGKTTINKLLDVAREHGSGVWEVLHRLKSVDVGATTRAKLEGFAKLMDDLVVLKEGSATLGELGAEVTSRVGYLKMLQEDDGPESDARAQNLQELVASMDEFQIEVPDATLATFLENVTLKSAVDDVDDGHFVSLMTVHAAKGLEFPAVFVTGLEERVFPFRGLDPWDDPDELAEERRLAYVAFTRARKRLVLSFASMRRLFGQLRVGLPSRFLAELPVNDVQWIGLDALGSQRPTAKTARSRDDFDGWDDEPAPRNESRDKRASGSYVDHSEGSDLVDRGVTLGMYVRHIKFGVGKVHEVLEGSPPRVTVKFPEVGLKKIVATYLEPV